MSTESCCETRTATVAQSALLALTCFTASACVIHQPGLAVEVWIDAPDGPRGAPLAVELRATEVSLVPCPGEPVDATHTHGGQGAIGLDADVRVSLAPTPGRYCDLRVQLESAESVPRQAVVPLSCAGRPTPLTLGAAQRGRPATLRVWATDPPPHAVSAQQRIDAWLRALTVERVDCPAPAAP